MNEPGGGRRVRLTEPNGYQIEVIHSMRSRGDDQDRARYGEHGQRAAPPQGPLDAAWQVADTMQRIGHGVLSTPKVKETVPGSARPWA